MKKTFIILICVLALYGCDWLFSGLNTGKNTTNSEPVYIPDIAWQTEVNYQIEWSYPYESGGYGYYVEKVFPLNIAHCRLLKIDLSNGKIIWRAKEVEIMYTDQGQKIGDYVYMPLRNKDIILVYDDNNGALAATVSLNSGTPTSGSVKGVHGNHTAAWEKYIFWGNFDRPNWEHGLMRFDTGRIDFTMAPDAVQLVEPELVWPHRMQSSISTNIIINDGTVYFLTTRHWFDSGTVRISYLVAMDAQTGKVLWVTERDFGWGNRENSLLLKDDRLYVLDRNPSCYNAKTGKPVFEKKDDVYEYAEAGSMLKGISWYDNKLYFTTQRNSYTHILAPEADMSKVKNIVCIDGDTGNLVWGDLVPDGISIFTNPLVANGKVYVVTDKGLRVYNAKTGALIGVDKTVDNLGNNHNLLYDNMVIYPDRKGENANPPYAVLTAIKAY